MPFSVYVPLLAFFSLKGIVSSHRGEQWDWRDVGTALEGQIRWLILMPSFEWPAVSVDTTFCVGQHPSSLHVRFLFFSWFVSRFLLLLWPTSDSIAMETLLFNSEEVENFVCFWVSVVSFIDLKIESIENYEFFGTNHLIIALAPFF